MTLYITPVVYYYVNRIQAWVMLRIKLKLAATSADQEM